MEVAEYSGKRTLIHVPRKKNAGGLQFTLEIGSQSLPEVLRVHSGHKMFPDISTCLIEAMDWLQINWTLHQRSEHQRDTDHLLYRSTKPRCCIEHYTNKYAPQIHCSTHQPK